MKNDVMDVFKRQFHTEPELIIRAPGRINLIGEHTDYNMGWVLPAAINKNIFLAFSLARQDIYTLRGSVGDELVTCTPGKLVCSQPHWSKYLTGILELLLKDGYPVKGFNLAFSGDIPIGAGLSSSAALCCGFIYGLNTMHRLNLTYEEMIAYAQKAEHVYAGVNCGIMDQYAVLFGREGSFLKLDCQSLSMEYIPANLGEYLMLLCDSSVKHKLAESTYNERREECEMSVKKLSRIFPGISSLRDVSLQMLGDARKELDANEYKRCNYVLEENLRQEEVCMSLRQGNVLKIGALLYKTHLGLRHEYEVSCPELDFLVDTAMRMGGVAGARMMGGGFGGCSINIIQKAKAGSFVNELTEKYAWEFHRPLSVHEVKITQGVSIA